jgi:hypothetical protein
MGVNTNWSEGVQGGAAQPVFVVGGGVAGSGGSGVPTSESWRLALLANVSGNDSIKEFDVPAAQEWQVLGAYVTFSTSADVGDRQVILEVLDALGNVIYTAIAGVVQAASVDRKYQFAPGLEPMTAFIDTTFLTVPIGPVFLGALWQLRVRDSKAIAAAADDLQVQLVYAWRAV